MKILKWIIIVVVALVAFVLIVPIFLPSHYSVERTTVINVDQDAAFSYVVDLRNWEEWIPWMQMDPTAKVMITGTPNDVGGLLRWEGEEIGRGEYKLSKIEEPAHFEAELTFLDPQEMKSLDSWNFEDIGNGQTKVTWELSGDLDYPIDRFLGLFMDSMLGEDFENGLNNLKSNLEQ